MMGWVEQYAVELLRSVDPPRDLDRLLIALEDRVTVWVAPGQAGFCLHWPDGTAEIWVPRGDRYFESLAHELGHALLTTGLARYLMAHNPQLARRQGWKEEAIANRFAAALMRAWAEDP
jgi:hypothetical protein